MLLRLFRVMGAYLMSRFRRHPWLTAGFLGAGTIAFVLLKGYEVGG